MNHLRSARSSLRALQSMVTRTALPVALAAMLTTACVYHAPIQQGNLLDAKDIDQISVGMTQAQVRYVLGTPMVADPFSTNRWDYLYYVKRTNMPDAKKQQLVVYFESGSVSKLERTELSVVKIDPRLKEEDQKLPWYKRWLNKIKIA